MYECVPESCDNVEVTATLSPEIGSLAPKVKCSRCMKEWKKAQLKP